MQTFIMRDTHILKLVQYVQSGRCTQVNQRKDGKTNIN
jgi:hypothetical protein